MGLRVLLTTLSLLLVGCAATVANASVEMAHLRIDTVDQTKTAKPISEIVEEPPRFRGFARTYQGHVPLAAFAEHGLEVYESPGSPQPFMKLPGTTILGTTMVVGLIGEPHNGWAKVLLPMRPNGKTGWIRTDDTQLFVVSGKIVIDVSDRTLTYYQNEIEVLTASVAVGSEVSPTPVGRFYVTDSVTLTKAGTPWGPHALGLSARSEHVTEFNGGDGIIGIHGTSQPSSIGKAASLGCVRLHNDEITRLHSLVPVGTPVEIRA